MKSIFKIFSWTLKVQHIFFKSPVCPKFTPLVEFINKKRKENKFVSVVIFNLQLEKVF